MKTFEEFWQWQVCVPTNMEDEARCIWNAATESAKPRWIPVTERLPENPGDYLVKAVSFKSPEYPNLVMIDEFDVIDGFPDSVKYWMELPK